MKEVCLYNRLGVKYIEMYFNTNTLESISNTISNTFQFQDVLLCE